MRHLITGVLILLLSVPALAATGDKPAIFLLKCAESGTVTTYMAGGDVLFSDTKNLSGRIGLMLDLETATATIMAGERVEVPIVDRGGNPILFLWRRSDGHLNTYAYYPETGVLMGSVMSHRMFPGGMLTAYKCVSVQ